MICSLGKDPATVPAGYAALDAPHQERSVRMVPRGTGQQPGGEGLPRRRHRLVTRPGFLLLSLSGWGYLVGPGLVLRFTPGSPRPGPRRWGSGPREGDALPRFSAGGRLGASCCYQLLGTGALAPIQSGLPVE